ncbi:hypothetical protein V2J09_018565 [Rumex salicifolius]
MLKVAKANRAIHFLAETGGSVRHYRQAVDGRRVESDSAGFRPEEGPDLVAQLRHLDRCRVAGGGGGLAHELTRANDGVLPPVRAEIQVILPWRSRSANGCCWEASSDAMVSWKKKKMDA